MSERFPSVSRLQVPAAAAPEEEPPFRYVSIARLYYTLCLDCGALDDFAETRSEAGRNLRAHIAWHKAGKPAAGRPYRRP